MKDKESLPKGHPKVQTIKLKADGFDTIKVKYASSVKDTIAEDRWTNVFVTSVTVKRLISR